MHLSTNKGTREARLSMVVAQLRLNVRLTKAPTDETVEWRSTRSSLRR